MPLRLLPNVEGIVLAALKADADVTALVGGRVYSSLPSAKTWPAVRVTRFGGAPAFSSPAVLDAATLQVDVWAESKMAAFTAASTVRAVMEQRLPGVHPLGTVYRVDLGQFSYDPDEVYDPVLPRYISDFTVYAR